MASGPTLAFEGVAKTFGPVHAVDDLSFSVRPGAVTGFLSGGTELDPSTLGDRFTAMPIIITTWAGRPGPEWEQATAAAIVVLLVVVLLANAVAILLRNHYEKKRG